MRYLLLLFLLLSSFVSTDCQTYFEYYPVQFSQYMRHFQYINPASTGANSRFEAVLGSRNHVGNFSNISTYFISAGYATGEPMKAQRPYSAFGFRADTDQEGKYISRTRAYAMYAFHFRIFEDYCLSGGIEMGFLNISVEGTPSTGNESEYVPDASSGIWFYGKGLQAGFSVNQILQSKLQPYVETSILRRHINATAIWRFEPSKWFSVTPSVMLRYPSYLKYNADYSVELGIADVVGGMSIKHRLGAAFWFGIAGINIAGGRLESVITYNTPLKKSIININTFEILCKYRL